MLYAIFTILLIGILIVFLSLICFPGFNLNPSLLTAFITVTTGIIVLTLGQIIIKFFIEPFQRQQQCIEEISYSISFYADLWTNPGKDFPEERKEASKTFRGLAGKLISTTSSVKWYYPLFTQSGIGMSYKKINEIKSKLIVLSRNIWADDRTSVSKLADKNLQKVHDIEKALNLKTNLGINMDEIFESLKK